MRTVDLSDAVPVPPGAHARALGPTHPNARPDARARAWDLATIAAPGRELDWARRYMAADSTTRRGLTLELD